MSRVHPQVRLHRGDFSGEWSVVRVASDGRSITDRWPLHPDDSIRLDEAFRPPKDPCGGES